MNTRNLALTLTWVMACLGLSANATVAQESEKTLQEKRYESEALFVRRVETLLREKCFGCHGNDPDSIEGSLDIGSLKGLLAGGDSGDPSVIQGDAQASPLYLAATRESDDWSAMPPKEAEQLTKEQLQWLRDWIDHGAAWPDATTANAIKKKYADQWSVEDGIEVKTSGGLDDNWTHRKYDPAKLWAYQPLEVIEPPQDVHPVDWFIDRQLTKAGLEPATDATARAFARRLSFGLTGLPPMTHNTAELSQFETEFQTNPDRATRRYIRQLMNSYQYGEHFARNWLDVVRYADSSGFANDYTRPNAWRYRDYVIRAFNSDKPYNEFVREQIAGDEMDAKDVEKRIATGFLRMGPWEQTSMSVFRVTRVQWLDDVTDSVGQAFLGHAMQCAKCHDHKFDPIPTRDYYRMMAVFSTTQFAEVNAPFLPSENKTGFQQSHKWTQAKIASYVKQKQALEAKIKANKQKEKGDATVGNNGLDPGDENSLARMNKNIARHRWELEKVQPIAFSVYTGKTIERKNVSKRILKPVDPWKKGTLEKDTILSGGDAYSRGDVVSPGALSAAESLGNMPSAEFPNENGKRRLALANWIVDERNPLTARVIVNRVWAWHFGVGLAGNPNNVGGTGKLPTHPRLLDFLADWFVKHDWSIKQLNELILTSNVYRRASQHHDPNKLEQLDPNRQFYAVFRPRRLTAEEFRDAMLAVSGELNHQVGGVPCRPDINQEVAMQPRQIMGGTASVYEPDPLPDQRNRRSVYAERIRGLRDPFMETFNQPGPDKSCELRETSTVAPQALTLFNALEVQDRALAFAARLLKDESQKDDDRAVICQAFELALGRRPTTTEVDACLEHWQRAVVEESKKKYTPPTFATQTRRTVMAEKTGEPYDFIEFMPVYEEYVADLQPHQVDAKTRGLAQVCLIVFNLNEFAYVD